MNLNLPSFKIKIITYLILPLVLQAVLAQAESISENPYEVTPIHVERTCNPGGGYPTNGISLLGIVDGNLYEFYFATGKTSGRKFRQVIEMAPVLEGAVRTKEPITIVLTHPIEKLVMNENGSPKKIFDPFAFISVSVYGSVWKPSYEPDPGYVGSFCK